MLTVEAAGARVARDLEEAERFTNESLRALARLNVSMMNVRLDTDLPQYQGQTAVIRLQEAQKQMVDAMSNLTRVHKSLRDDFTRITGLPDTPKRCPTQGISETAVKNVA
ncbi:hypothetical protein M3P36_14575 [Altererythrobacter sp. KTW20L]|uniref:hypothetical protein n=1 Tax=Altererythrobacter sp. KTW20L TaxID=2942210 RepID=UPI0020BF7E70|nr:hypothetical protein [Altererythrobacter sp. KTW20L]MCL6252264.1 hypothetical protein [Altererythrobacter sp. KTW20L]